MRKRNFFRVFALLFSFIIACSMLSVFGGCKDVKPQATSYQRTSGRLAAYGQHAYCIDNDGNLWGWVGKEFGFDGRTEDGQLIYKTNWDAGKLGLEEDEYPGEPVIIKPGTKFTCVATDYFGTAFAIDVEGNLWSWGTDQRHIMGYETEQGVLCKPRILVDGVKFSSVSIDGEVHVLALDVEGGLWAWGSNHYGQFGNGTREGSVTPIRVLPEMRFKQAVAGWMESYLIDVEGRLWWCGTHQYRMFDDKLETDGEWELVPGEYPDMTTVPVQLMPDKRFIDVSTFLNSNTYAIDEDGVLWARGDNDFGQLGVGTTEDSEEFIPCNDNFEFSAVTGGNTVLGITPEGRLYGWGGNGSGMLCVEMIRLKAPVCVMKETRIVDFVTNKASTLYILDEHGDLWVTGYNPFAWFGDPETQFNYTTPTRFYLGGSPENA